MKKYILLLTLTLMFIQVFGQSIKGSIKNGGKGLPNITIRLFRDSVLSKAAISDSVGHYKLPGLEKGFYKLEFSSINYQSKSVVFNLRNDTIVNVSLSPLSQKLNEVQVKAKTPLIERKIDRLIFNVAGNVNIIGLNALDVLSQTPMVSVDNNGYISIIGKGKVAIMINGKIMQMPTKLLVAYLKAIPAERVERIEVITNPPAMYSAEGQGGIINIVLKKNKKPGYRGSTNLTLQKTSYVQGSGAVNMWYNRKHIRYFGSIFSFLGAHRPIHLRSFFYPTQIRKSSSKRKEYSQGIVGRIGFDADLSKTTTLGASYSRMNSFPYQYTTIHTQFIDKQTKDLDSASVQNNTNKTVFALQSANVHLVKKLDTASSKRIVIDGDWSWNSVVTPNRIETETYNPDHSPLGSLQTFSHSHLVTSVYSLNGVVLLPKKNHEWSFGGRIDFIRDNHELSLKINNQDHLKKSGYNKYIYHENTQALFVNFKNKLGKKWSFQSGLRGEYTQIKGISHSMNDSTNTHSYLKLFPTVYLLYHLNSKNTLSINYGRRINRPGFSSLNPYIRYYDQYSYSQGNPNLKPSISNNFELTETYSQNLNISIQYNFSNNGISVIPVPQKGDSHIVIYQHNNDLSTRSFVFSSSYVLNQIKWLQSLNSLEIYYNKSISTSKYTKPTLEGWSASFRSNNSFYFNKKKTLVGGLLLRYKFPGVESIYRFYSSYHIDLSGKYTLLNNKLQIGLRLSDIFKTGSARLKYKVNGVLYSVKANNNSRRLYLTLKYNFGNSKLKKGRSHFQNPASGR